MRVTRCFNKCVPWVVLLGLMWPAVIYAGTVKLYNWEEYLSNDVILKFESETGHTVSQRYYDDEDVRDRAMVTGRANAYDLVLMDNHILHLLMDQGSIQNLSSVDSSNHDQQWRKACGPTGVPYTWGTMGIIYRESVSKTPITSWRQLFSVPEEHRGGIVMPYDTVDAVAAALFSVGADPFSEDKLDLRKAYELLREQKPHLLAAAGSEAFAYEKGADHGMTLGLSFTGEVDTLITDLGQEDWVYVVPDEGTLFWTECWVAPAGKPISEATVAFLEFMNRPEIAAINAEYIWVPTTVPAAVALASEEYRGDESLFPAEELFSRSRNYQKISNAGLEFRNRMLHKLEK